MFFWQALHATIGSCLQENSTGQLFITNENYQLFLSKSFPHINFCLRLQKVLLWRDRDRLNYCLLQYTCNKISHGRTCLLLHQVWDCSGKRTIRRGWAFRNIIFERGLDEKQDRIKHVCQESRLLYKKTPNVSTVAPLIYVASCNTILQRETVRKQLP